jgi:RNA polymerase sigma-70 factor (ECF subfamily)
VLLLRDVFDYSVRETAEALDLSEANTKQIHLRARKRMKAYNASRRPPTAELQAQTAALLGELVQHVIAHDVAGVEALLTQDARVINDSAGEFTAATRPVLGPSRAAKFLVGVSTPRCG